MKVVRELSIYTINFFGLTPDLLTSQLVQDKYWHDGGCSLDLQSIILFEITKDGRTIPLCRSQLSSSDFYSQGTK
jgi:hypothetical protein